MFGILQSRNEAAYEPRDVVAIFKDDGTAEIVSVVTVDEHKITAGPYVGDTQYTIPMNHVKSFTGPTGRIFLYPTTVENVVDCERIAALERSTVLRHITHFDQEPVMMKKPISKAVIFGIAAAIFILIILVVR